MSIESSKEFERTVTNWIQKHPLSVYYTTQDEASFLSQEFNKVIESRYKSANQIVVSQEYAAKLINKSLEDVKEAISEGFASLQATFEWGVAEIVWELEQQHKVLVDILEVLQAPLDTQAKELRKRGEYAFRNGWYDEAEKEFLNSEDKNPYDFSIHWNLGYIYLFHKPNPTKALKYFKNAVKYSAPKSTYYAANALRHVALIYYLQKEFNQAYESTQQAIQLHPKLYDAYYQHAQHCVCLGKYDEAIQNLKIAITQGGRLYLLNADSDDVFNVIQGKIETLVNELIDDARKKIEIKLQPTKDFIEYLKRFDYLRTQEIEQLLNEKYIVGKSYFELLDNIPNAKEENKIIFDNAINEIDKKISDIKVEAINSLRKGWLERRRDKPRREILYGKCFVLENDKYPIFDYYNRVEKTLA